MSKMSLSVDPRYGKPAKAESAALVSVPPILPTSRAQLTEARLALPADASEGEWIQTGRALGRMQHASMWWIGDWWNFGAAHKYGDLKRAAATTGIPSNTIRTAAQVARQCDMRISLLGWQHHQVVSPLPASEQETWLRTAADGDGTKPWTVRQLKDAMRQAATRARVAEVPEGEEFRVIRGDFRTADVADASVDWIITDPPYPAEFLPLYGDLGAFAERVLRPGGSVVAMVGQSYLPAVMAQLGERLTYHWTLAYLTPGGQAVQLWDRKVNTFWKPLLWYVKGDYAGKWIGDVARSEVNDNDKRFHDWGQSESGMADIVERFTEAGELILDPFGGGMTTGIVAQALGRRFIGIEIDETRVA